MALTLSSPAFGPDGSIPAANAGDGQDISPPLEWTEPTAGVVELALLCEDLNDAEQVQWIVYKIPADMRTLIEGLPKLANLGLENGVQQGKNSAGRFGWSGPQPPRGHGEHRFRFRLLGLRAPLEVVEGASRAQVEAALTGLVVDEAELIGRYERGGSGRGGRRPPVPRKGAQLPNAQASPLDPLPNR